MHHNCIVIRKLRFYVVFQFLICNTIFNVTARPGFDSNHKNSFHSISEKKENVTLTLDDIFPNYIVTSEFCDDDSCKRNYEVANYPYEQITDVFPEVSKRLWDHVETSTYTIFNRGKEEDEEDRAEEPGNNGTFRMQSVPSKDIANVNYGSYPNYGYSDPKRTNRCSEIRQTILPLTGKSGGKTYYITNIKTFSQSLTIIKCSRIGISCGNKSVDPESISYSCKQEYEDAQLSSFPVEESISLESHRTIPFKVPKGCICSMSWLG